MSRPLDLLFVDDDPDIRTVVALALALDPDTTVRTAASAAEALALLADRAPDACLFDVMMPHMNGLDLLAEVRGRGMAVPVIFLTARARDPDMGRYQAAGALGTLAKPFDPLRLGEQIRQLLGR